MELGDREDLRVGPEGHPRAGLLRGADGLDRRDRLALLVGLLPDLAVAPNLDVEALRQRVDHRDADAVEAARDLVGVVVELPARVEVRHDDLERLALVLVVHPDRDAAPVVLDRDGVVGVDRRPRRGRRSRPAPRRSSCRRARRPCGGDPTRSSVSPMYMPGRLRTASRPFRSLIESVVYAVLYRTPFKPSRHAARAGGAAWPDADLEDRGDAPAEPRRRRRARQENRRSLGQPLEKLRGPALREPGVEVVGGEQGSLASETLDGAPLGELGERHGAGDFAREDACDASGRPAARPEQVVPVRARERVAAAALDGGDPRALRARGPRRIRPPRSSRRGCRRIRPRSRARARESPPARPRARRAGGGARPRPETHELLGPGLELPRLRRDARAALAGQKRVSLAQRRAVASEVVASPPAGRRARAGPGSGAGRTGDAGHELSGAPARGRRPGRAAEISRKVADFPPRENERPAARDQLTRDALRRRSARRTSAPNRERLRRRGASPTARARRNERWPHTSATASRRFVFALGVLSRDESHTLAKGDGVRRRDFGSPGARVRKGARDPVSLPQRRIGMTT